MVQLLARSRGSDARAPDKARSRAPARAPAEICRDSARAARVPSPRRGRARRASSRSRPPIAPAPRDRPRSPVAPSVTSSECHSTRLVTTGLPALAASSRTKPDIGTRTNAASRSSAADHRALLPADEAHVRPSGKAPLAVGAQRSVATEDEDGARAGGQFERGNRVEKPVGEFVAIEEADDRYERRIVR